MTSWATTRRFGVAAALAWSVFALPSIAANPPAAPATAAPAKPAKPTPAQLREIAEKAEKAGDWEAAFNAYCHLFVAERNSPELREKLNTTLRRVQQVRRHRDPGFQQFVGAMQLGGGLDLFSEVVLRVPTIYVERERATPQNLWTHGVEELDRALGSQAFRQAFLDNPRADKVDAFRAVLRRDWAKREIADHKEARAALRQLIAAAQDAFPVRVPAALAIECACGACSGLDEYTVFLTPNQPGAEAAAIPDLSAVGLYFGATKDGIVVQAVAPGSWAAHHTALRRGDRIQKVNGRDATNFAKAAEALRHPINGFQQLELPATRDNPAATVRIPLVVPTVFGTKIVNPAAVEKIGFARIGGFSPTTPRELDDAINFLKAEGAQAVVLDLRGNHGGSFLAGVEVARRLLPGGLIVTTQGQTPEVNNQVFSSMSGMSAHDIPLVMLIDAETASAAEVLAAALKDNDRAKLVGMPSFGKGTVQYPLRLMTLDDVDPSGRKVSKTGTVRVTIAKLIAPRGGPINGLGVTPDFLEADYAQQFDLAVEKAIEQLSMSMMRRIQMLPEPQVP